MSSTLLAYSALIGPLLLPFLLAYLWRKRLRHKTQFMLIGAFACCW